MQSKTEKRVKTYRTNLTKKDEINLKQQPSIFNKVR